LEDHSNFLYGPWHLQRLALISLIKGNAPLAHMCLETLEKSILYRTWAKDHKPYLANPRLVNSNSRFAYLSDLNITTDFIITPAYPEQDMEMLLRENPDNRAAFEYLMADYLLTFRLGEFVRNLLSTSHLNAPFLPRHYQEALLGSIVCIIIPR
jgi:hypothetical protein